MAKIKNMHYTICLKVISSSAQVALPPAFARLEQRGANNQPVDMIKMKDSLHFNRGTKALIFLCPRLVEALVPLL